MNHTFWRQQDSCALSPRRIVSYDSEFVREKSYYPKLALIQLHQPDWRQAILCDPLAADLAPLWAQLSAHKAPVVLHAGSQDLELMHAACGNLPAEIRDTQIGFALLSEHRAISYASLVLHYLGIELDKTETRSDWLSRPLTDAQCGYAADDVGLLSRLYPLLTADLAAKGRLDWWREDSAALLQAQTEPNEPIHWYKLRTAPQLLRRSHLPAAEALVQLREQLAADSDLPRRHIMPDEQLVKIALAMPKSWLELAEHLHEDHRMLCDAALANDCFQRFQAEAPPEKPRTARSSAAEKQQYARLEKFIAAAAADLGIHPDTIAPPRQMRSYLACPDTAPINRGWRASILSHFKR